MAKTNFDPELQRDLHEFPPIETQYAILTVVIQQYNDKIPEVYTRRNDSYGGRKPRKLGRWKYDELPLLIPVYIEAFKWITKWLQENHRDEEKLNE